MTSKGQSQKDARMRREGYDDGYALLPAKRKEAEYQRAWRNGRAARDRAESHLFLLLCDAAPERR